MGKAIFRKYQVVLGLHNQSNVERIQKAISIVEMMSTNVYFPSPLVPYAQVSAQILAAQDAYTELLIGGKGKASIMYNEMSRLEYQLSGLQAYVENVASANQDYAIPIIQSSGMELKRPPDRSAKTFSVKKGNAPGMVILNTKAKRYAAYIYEMNLNPADASGWVKVCVSQISRYELFGLTSDRYHYFRVALLTKSVQGPWSVILKVMVN